MKAFFAKIFDKIVENRTYALLVSVALFIGIIVGIPYLTSEKTTEKIPNKPNVQIENNTTYTGSTKVANELDLSMTTELDNTEVVEIEESFFVV